MRALETRPRVAEIDPRDVLRFWFGSDLDSAAVVKSRCELWFGRNDSFDAEIARRFARLPDQVLGARLADWQDDARSSLALAIVLDQFPRNLYRGSARAFAFDPRALQLPSACVDQGFDREVRALEAVFFYLPFEHAEETDAQERSLALFTQLLDRAPGNMLDRFEEFLDYARRHRDVIRRFGRFPHRNRLLGRQSSAEELAYLASGGERFGA